MTPPNQSRRILIACTLCLCVAFSAVAVGARKSSTHAHSVGADAGAQDNALFIVKSKPINWFASEESVTGAYFNVNAGIRWRNEGGDWADARGVAQGIQPFAVARVTDTDSVKDVVWDVTKLVTAWQAEPARSAAILLKGLSGDTIRLRSNQSGGSEPRLVITFDDHQTAEFIVAHDTSVDTSTARPLGADPEGQVTTHVGYLLQWHRGELFSGSKAVKSAVLHMVSAAQYGTCDVGVFQLVNPVSTVQPVLEAGLAARYVADSGLQNDPDVVFFEDFHGISEEIESRWNGARFTGFDACDLPGAPQCARASVKGTADGGNGLAGVVGRKMLPHELEEAYMRYYIKFDSFPALDSGKLPGLANYDAGDGTPYFAGGNGGDAVSGYNGWTLRGGFSPPLGTREPAPGRIPLHTYAYHGAMRGDYGDNWSWAPAGTDLHLIQPGEWHSIEQRVKVNTPGRRDGIFEVWIDGRKVLSKTDILLRADHTKTPRSYPNGKPVPKDQKYWVPGNMGITKLWANLYHGGRTPAKNTLVVHWANFVVATSYIGPMRRAP